MCKINPDTVELRLADQQRTLKDVGLPENVFDWTRTHLSADAANDLARNGRLGAELQSGLNTDQQDCFQTIIAAIQDNPQTAHFYPEGPGGTGKTLLYKTLCYYFRSQNKAVLCVASTGIAALLLPDSRGFAIVSETPRNPGIVLYQK